MTTIPPSDDDIFAEIKKLADADPSAHARYFSDPLFRALVNKIIRSEVMDQIMSRPDNERVH